MSALGELHSKYVFSRRVRVLRDHLAEAIPADARALDVGCGDGSLSAMLCQKRPDITLQGIDVLVRENTPIPVTVFDGKTLPFDDSSFDVVMFVDVLHHTEDPMVLLREAGRVTRNAVVLKDHTRNGLLANQTLRAMDWAGNARYGVALPYNYWPEARWREAFQTLGWRIGLWRSDLKLYPPPLDWLFGRSLHFIARLEKAAESV